MYRQLRQDFMCVHADRGGWQAAGPGETTDTVGGGSPGVSWRNHQPADPQLGGKPASLPGSS